MTDYISAGLDDHETAYPELPVDQPSLFEAVEEPAADDQAEPVEVRSSEVIAAIEFAWGEIQKRNPELPSVFVTIGSGTKPGKGTNVTLGHFAALRWQMGEAKLHELFVGGEGLARGAKGVMTTLIHEAAHNVAHVRKIEDTSRQGRYHNKRFAALARELGLEPQLDKAIGWSPCAMPEATAAEYADALGRLDEALTIYRHSEMGSGSGKKSKNLAVAVCLCGTKIRLSRKAFESAPITCGACESTFVAVFDDEDDEDSPAERPICGDCQTYLDAPGVRPGKARGLCSDCSPV